MCQSTLFDVLHRSAPRRTTTFDSEKGPFSSKLRVQAAGAWLEHGPEITRDPRRAVRHGAEPATAKHPSAGHHSCDDAVRDSLHFPGVGRFAPARERVLEHFDRNRLRRLPGGRGRSRLRALAEPRRDHGHDLRTGSCDSSCGSSDGLGRYCLPPTQTRVTLQIRFRWRLHIPMTMTIDIEDGR